MFLPWVPGTPPSYVCCHFPPWVGLSKIGITRHPFDKWHQWNFAVVTWMFPKIGAKLPNHTILIGFSIINHPFWGPTPIFVSTPIYLPQREIVFQPSVFMCKLLVSGYTNLQVFPEKKTSCFFSRKTPTVVVNRVGHLFGGPKMMIHLGESGGKSLNMCGGLLENVPPKGHKHHRGYCGKVTIFWCWLFRYYKHHVLLTWQCVWLKRLLFHVDKFGRIDSKLETKAYCFQDIHLLSNTAGAHANHITWNILWMGLGFSNLPF